MLLYSHKQADVHIVKVNGKESVDNFFDLNRLHIHGSDEKREKNRILCFPSVRGSEGKGARVVLN